MQNTVKLSNLLFLLLVLDVKLLVQVSFVLRSGRFGLWSLYCGREEVINEAESRNVHSFFTIFLSMNFGIWVVVKFRN